jgi:hypothetical protein
MISIPHYDEFGIYTTIDDIKNYITSLIEEGFSSEDDVINKCIEFFGRDNIMLIEKTLYSED